MNKTKIIQSLNNSKTECQRIIDFTLNELTSPFCKPKLVTRKLTSYKIKENLINDILKDIETGKFD